MPLISIIVPVYKIKEEYLRKCIDSLVNQTFENIEIILVNDGTPDNGGAICEEYAAKDKRIKVIHQENRGVSVARNHGLEIATGDWITFVDADDWIVSNTCEILKDSLTQDMDILMFALKVNFPNKEAKNPFWNEESAFLNKNDREELQLQLLYKTVSKYSPPYNMVGVAVCKLYNKKFLTKHNFKFQPELPLSEDGVFAFWALEYAKKVFYINEFLYHYRKHADSATLRYREDAKSDYDKGLKELEKILIKLKKSEEFYRALNYRAILNIFIVSNQSYCNKLNDLPTLKKIQAIKEHCNSEPYYSAIKNSSIKKYSSKNGFSQIIGFTILKLRMYAMFYYFTTFKNMYTKLRRGRRNS